MNRILFQSLVGGLAGGLIMGLCLSLDGFNPLNNGRLIYFGFSMGGLSSLLAAVVIRNKPYQPLTNQLHRYISSLPAGHHNWHNGIAILSDLESRQPAETKTRFPQKTRS